MNFMLSKNLTVGTRIFSSYDNDQGICIQGGNLKTAITTLAFIFLTVLPRGVMAETTDIKQCLRDIQVYWLNKSPVHFKGQTRTETPCELLMNINATTLTVHAAGAPLSVSFGLKESNGEETRTLQTCRVDNEKIHFVFEERTSADFEKRERVQMTLLKRHGKGISLILSKRENKILRPLQLSSLICHLN
jgi:hypothetical protein